ncbi:hypothetical protein [Runella zeae]|uniref:hypothetical protein n=1 Tax=Runella zeae TaxID=94255 RepID=UPI00048C5CC2|nr:hypothetical protein [Runella zeae]
MRLISEYVLVDETMNSVKFFGDEDWIEVEDLDAWIAAFWDACRDVAMEFNGCSSILEREAFSQTFDRKAYQTPIKF